MFCHQLPRGNKDITAFKPLGWQCIIEQTTHIPEGIQVN